MIYIKVFSKMILFNDQFAKIFINVVKITIVRKQNSVYIVILLVNPQL